MGLVTIYLWSHDVSKHSQRTEKNHASSISLTQINPKKVITNLGFGTYSVSSTERCVCHAEVQYCFAL